MQSSPALEGDSPRRVPPNSASELLDEYAECWRRVRHLMPETIREHRTYLDRFVEVNTFDCSEQLLEWLCGSHLLRFAVDYAQTHGPGSQRWMQESLRNFLRFCHYRGYISAALWHAVPSRRRRRLDHIPKSLPDESIEQLLASIDRNCPLGRRDTAIILTATTYGVRGVQLRTLQLEDIDWQAEEIHFNAAKGGKALRLPLTATVGNAILDYLQRGRSNEAPYSEIFLQARAPFKPFRWSGSFSNIVSRRLQQAGIELPEGVSRGLHGFRHAFAARLTGREPLKHIADLLGHRDIGSTFIYTKVNFDELADTALPWPEEGI